MVSALVSGSSDPGSSLAGDIMFCSWARHFTLTVPLSTQMYKWISVNSVLGVALQWTSIPSRGGVEILPVTSCCRNWDKLQPDGPLGLYADFTLTSDRILFCKKDTVTSTVISNFQEKRKIGQEGIVVRREFERTEIGITRCNCMYTRL